MNLCRRNLSHITIVVQHLNRCLSYNRNNAFDVSIATYIYDNVNFDRSFNVTSGQFASQEHPSQPYRLTNSNDRLVCIPTAETLSCSRRQGAREIHSEIGDA